MNGLPAGSQARIAFLFLPSHLHFAVVVDFVGELMVKPCLNFCPPVKLIRLTIFSSDAAISSVLDLKGGA